MILHTEEVREDLIVRKPLRTKHIESNIGTKATTTQEVRSWLRANTKKHWYFYHCKETYRLRIAFHDKGDAMMWKLVWH